MKQKGDGIMKKSTAIILITVILVVVLVVGIIIGTFLPRMIEEAKEEVGENITSPFDEEGSRPNKKNIGKENPDSSSKENLISEEEAKKIALDYAGLSEETVEFAYAKLEKDDGIWQYEIEFRQGREEYDFDIDAATGEILSYSRDDD